MDNITRLPPGIDAHRIITLTPTQYALYQTSCVEIHAPNGEYLESIGQPIKKEADDINAYQLRDYVYLIGCLLGKINEEIDLPAQAVSGLSNLMYRMQEFFEKSIK